MKLWLLRPVEGLPKETNPWRPKYDKALGFVVRAETENEARKMANDAGGDETGPIQQIVYRTGGDPWLDPSLSTCVELTGDGEPGVIIDDVYNA